MSKAERNRRWLEKRPDYYAEWRAAHPEYASWSAMVQRCTNPKSPNWRLYGGRGITVCEPWLKDFGAFLDHIGPRPGQDYSIDRIDNDGNYEPGNVRWATRSEQQRNKRSGVSEEAIAFIREGVAEGLSWRGIADALNELSIPAPRGGIWYGSTAKDAAVRAVIEGQDR